MRIQSMLGASAAVIGLGCGGVALAQSADDEIIVTAQKREENVQDVPISIAAVSGAQLEESGVATLEGIQRLAPGVTMSTIGSGVASYTYIRGAGTNLLDASSDPSVAFFIDEVYVPGSAGLQFDLVDVARVEVLKGPQGTLFGRNAAAGAFSIITRRPENEFSGSLGVEAGNYGLLIGRGSITGPLTSDGSWQYRLSAAGRHRDPVTENLIGTDPGEVNTYSGRAQLEYEGASLAALLTLDYFNADNGQADIFMLSPFAGAVLDNGAGGLNARNAALPTESWQRHYLDFDDGFEEQQAWMSTLRLEWDLGFADLTSITAYRDSEFDSLNERDGSLADALRQRSFEAQRSYSQELRLANDYDRWRWVAGLYFYHADTDRNDQYRFGPDMFAFPNTLGVPITDDHSITVDSYAAFGQATFDLTDRLSLTFGGRYTIDEKESDRTINTVALGLFGPAVGFTNPINNVNLNDDWQSFDPSATLEFEADEDVLLYASYRRGFKSGGFQTLFPTTALASSTYEPEHVTSYELGFKSEFLDRRLTINAALFRAVMEDQQVSRQIGVSLFVENAGETITDGIDLQIGAQLTDNFRIDWSSTLQSARFETYDPPPAGPGGGLFSGNHQLRSPDYASSFAAEYVVPLGGADLSFRGEYFYQSTIYFNEANYRAQPGVFQPEYGLFNARVAYEPEGRNWDLALWGRNLGDEEYCRNIILFGTPAPGTGMCNPGDPQTYGVSFNLRY